MNDLELMRKYQALLIENQRLREEVEALKVRLGIENSYDERHEEAHKVTSAISNSRANEKQIISTFSPEEKIEIFLSLFKGREDVFAKRWENPKKGTAGYSPVCRNEWILGLCNKPKIKCSECANKAYIPLSQAVIDDHLRGKTVAGIYPMLPDETCWFLAMDFDGADWEEDVKALSAVCRDLLVPVAVERSRSGNGGHVWFFFEEPVSAATARKLGSALLTHAMSTRHEIAFKSYDRLFPNQDTMPKGGFGNLIALPLQKAAREAGNSVFIDESLSVYDDQWGFLASLSKLPNNQIEALLNRLSRGNELGQLRDDDEAPTKPWETKKLDHQLHQNDFPKSIDIVKANMLYISKKGVSQRALNSLKRLAAFKNPEFHKAQAMRISTFGKPRVISCSEETEEYLCLPRGCEDGIEAMFQSLGIIINTEDITNPGRPIDIAFVGSLHDEQQIAFSESMKYDCGVLSGTTAFGKTVVAIKLIAERKTNTLILVDKVSLVSQWKERLATFLSITEPLPEANLEKKRGRKKYRSVIGQIGAGKDNLSGIIDIAVMQSLNRMGEVKRCVEDYGMVIVDECHHVSAFSFEQILKSVRAKYVYGLTATPTRKDGHHPIIFMQCGPIRYRDDAAKQAEKRPFDHFVIPRFTRFRAPLDKNEADVTIQELYAEIVNDALRNELIIDDVVRCYESGRNCLVLTERTAHVEFLTKQLSERIPGVISLTGGMGHKNTREVLKRIGDTPIDQQLTLVATGKFIGEGFDEPRLDTLFLAMPISWKGTLQQYAGRLHRLFETKNEVQIYDYVDVQVRMLEKMYHKRLAGYASIGYKAKGDGVPTDGMDIIFDNSNFLPVYSNDILTAEREVMIVSPFMTKQRVRSVMQYLRPAVANKVKVVIVTRPLEDFKEADQTRLKDALSIIQGENIKVIFRSNIHQKFALIDQKVVWYGSMNLLSYGKAEGSIMRLESTNIANELIRSIEKPTVKR